MWTDEPIVWFIAAATRVIRRRNHRLQSCPLQIALLPDSEAYTSEEDEEAFEESVCSPEGMQSTSDNVSTIWDYNSLITVIFNIRELKN